MDGDGNGRPEKAKKFLWKQVMENIKMVVFLCPEKTCLSYLFHFNPKNNCHSVPYTYCFYLSQVAVGGRKNIEILFSFILN